MNDWRHVISAIGWDVDGTLFPPTLIPEELVYEHQIKTLVDTNGWDPVKAKRELERIELQGSSRTQALTALGVDGEHFFVNLWDTLPLEQFLANDERLIALFSRISSYRHVIITNSNRRDQVERKLRLLGLDPGIFAAFITSVDIGVGKPEARIFFEALSRLGEEYTTNPERMLFVGDSLKTDVIGAHRVGMKAALVWGESQAADLSLTTVYDLANFLDS